MNPIIQPKEFKLVVDLERDGLRQPIHTQDAYYMLSAPTTKLDYETRCWTNERDIINKNKIWKKNNAWCICILV